MMDGETNIKAGRIEPGMNFHERVWAMCARIPRGRVMTYGDLARAVGGEGFKGYRAVGGALNRNPYAPDVPCHRVVGHDGKLTGFAGGLEKKAALLAAEGVALTAPDRVDLKQARWSPARSA